MIFSHQPLSADACRNENIQLFWSKKHEKTNYKECEIIINYVCHNRILEINKM